MGRRWWGWALATAVVALVAFAPFRDSGGRVDTAGQLGDRLAPAGPGAAGGPDGGSAGAGASGLAGAPDLGAGTAGSPGATGRSSEAAPDAGGRSGAAPVPEVPDLREPTERELAVLGPLIAAMDTGQRAGTPLVLGIATSIVATGLPSEESLPTELRPVLAALAELIASPGAQVNQLTAQNSVYLAQLDRALGELAFANPALNATIHQTADVLAQMGRAAAPVSPPGAVSLGDLSILLTYFAAG